MKNLYLIPLLIAFFLSIPFIAQETDAEGEPTTIQSLLQLVQEGRTTEQNENTKMNNINFTGFNPLLLLQ